MGIGQNGKAGWIAIALGLAACATSGKDSKSGGTTTADGERAPANVGTTVPPEKFEEIDNFWRSKISQLQFDCYNPEVEKTGKKYQGYVSLLVLVVPGGKAQDVKVTSSSIGSAGIEQCIVDAARGWTWPDVPAPAPYNGSLSFKPAW